LGKRREMERELRPIASVRIPAGVTSLKRFELLKRDGEKVGFER